MMKKGHLSFNLKSYLHTSVHCIPVDDIPPVIPVCDDCGATVGLNIGGTIVQFTEPTATDNSGIVSLQSRTHAPGEFFIVGSTPITYVFVDGKGNTAECTFNVIITEGRTCSRF